MLLELEMVNSFNKTIVLLKTKNEDVGALKVKIYVLFYGDISRTVALRQIKYGRVKGRV
jgi:hypothetical protein